MIQIKNSVQIAAMREAGRITGEALLVARDHIREGISTKELDTVIRHHIEKRGAKPSFLGLYGFPGSACISINDEVIHGIPSEKRILREGDIVKIDVGAFYKGYHGDSARTFPVGRVSDEAAALIAATKQSFYEGVEAVKVGNRIGDIGAAVDSYIRSKGFSVVRRYVGHGIGRDVHEQPDVPNFGTPGRGPRLCEGLVIAIEPMVNCGTYEVRELSDGWTVKTADGRLSAHYENTVALTADGVINLTEVEVGE
ncbi:MAG: type I methionyl aminopeptidase [Ruminococcaceae bacterium]|nr:type I methionyl aminopeptidase [Oscillospiraceae bacterium]